MKLQELFESLDSDIVYKIQSEENDFFQTSTTIKDKIIKFTASIDKDYWDIEFAESDLNGNNFKFYKTKSGSELKVFSFILLSIKDFIKRYNPDKISFSADKSDGNRSQLYKIFVNRYAKLLGFKLLDISPRYKNSDVYKIDKFTLEKI